MTPSKKTQLAQR